MQPDSSYKCASILHVIRACFAAYRFIFAVHENIRSDEGFSSITCFPFFLLVFLPSPFIIFFCIYLSIDLLLLLVLVFSISIALGYFSPIFFFSCIYFWSRNMFLKTFCQSAFGCFFHFLFCILLFFVLFSISLFVSSFLSVFTSFLFTVHNSFHPNLLYSFADVIFLSDVFRFPGST